MMGVAGIGLQASDKLPNKTKIGIKLTFITSTNAGWEKNVEIKFRFENINMLYLSLLRVQKRLSIRLQDMIV